MAFFVSCGSKRFMPKLNPTKLAKDACTHITQNPATLLKTLKGFFGLQCVIPMDAIRYMVRELVGEKKAPQDIVLQPVPPGLRISATLQVMGTSLRVSGIVTVVEMVTMADQIPVKVKITDLSITTIGNSSSPIVGLLQSGAFDLAKPANLLSFFPKKPSYLLEAKEDLFTIDLLKLSKIGSKKSIQTTLSTLTPVLQVIGISTDGDSLFFQLKAKPSNIAESFAAVRKAVGG